MSTHQRPKDPEGAAIAARPWWIAPADLAGLATEPCQPTPEEKVLLARVERQISLGHFRIPQIPAVAARVVSLLARPEADSHEISKLIHEDQQLAADVICFSNSSLFAGATKNTNIVQAIGRVGFRRTRSLIFAASLRAAIYSGCEVALAEALWRHACGCAAIASRIAQNLRWNTDDLYLAGLFHDVGKTVVLSLIDTIALRSQHLELRPEFVEHALEEFHEGVGIGVVKHWKLPEQVIEAVMNHTEARGMTLTPIQAIVALADNVCHRLNVGETDDGRKIAGRAILDRLGATEADLPQLLDGVLDVAHAGLSLG